MERLHQREKEEFLAICKEHGLDRSDERLRVAEAFMAVTDHVTVPQLQKHLAANGYDLDAHFIAETLDLLCRYGFASTKQFEGQELQYEHRHLGWHHDHLICAKCGRILEFHNQELEALQQGIAREHHFSLLHHKMELYGICSRCRRERLPVMPLAFVLPGEKIVIDRLLGGKRVQQRLAEMGLTPGTELEVINASGPGPVIVAFRGSRLALGRGLSQKIMVAARNNLTGKSETKGKSG